jgi:hypothetical protein
MFRARKTALVFSLLALPLLAAGCGGGKSSSGPSTIPSGSQHAPLAQGRSVASDLIPGQIEIGLRGAIPASIEQIDGDLAGDH